VEEYYFPANNVSCTVRYKLTEVKGPFSPVENKKDYIYYRRKKIHLLIWYIIVLSIIPSKVLYMVRTGTRWKGTGKARKSGRGFSRTWASLHPSDGMRSRGELREPDSDVSRGVEVFITKLKSKI